MCWMGHAKVPEGRAVGGPAGLPQWQQGAPESGAGNQQWAADFLTRPEAIRAAGPLLELQVAGAGQASGSPSAGKRSWRHAPTASCGPVRLVPSRSSLPKTQEHQSKELIP